MRDAQQLRRHIERRQFLTRTSLGLGSAALAQLLDPVLGLASSPPRESDSSGILGSPHLPPRAKRVIYLFQSGAPSQLELFDHKPMLEKLHGEQLPDSVRRGQRLTGMSAEQSSLPLTASQFRFERHGKSGFWASELVPHMAGIMDELCFIRSLHTEAINHDPAITFFQTGSQLPGRPSMGAWASYGLGSENRSLPAFLVLISKESRGQPLYARLWGSGFLPTVHQGVQLRAGPDPVLFLNDPAGFDRADRVAMLEALDRLHRIQADETQDPEIQTRIAQYEMAFRMQTSVPEVMDLAGEPDEIYDLYGPDAREPGTYAANCLLARRLAERGVRFIQLYHQGWDQHGNLPRDIRRQCEATDQASAALVIDLKRRGLLEDTLVIWGGEFGRTSYCQGPLTQGDYGRDHHPRCFTIWLAGAGVKSGFSFGESDELGYNIVRDPVHVHDLQATILYLLGVDHERLVFRHQGRRFRLTDVHGQVVKDILA